MTHFSSTDPATGEVVWEGVQASPDACAQSVQRARRGLPGWRDATHEVRVATLRRYAAILDARRDALATLISRETGKPRWEGQAEVASMIAKVEVSIRAQAERAGETCDATAFGQARLRHRPQGVMLVLGPFNFPGHLPNGHIVPALLAGNSLVFKPSELTPAVGEAMVAALHKAGVPEDAVILVQGGRETGAALAAQPIDGLLFTGSPLAGMQLRRQFAERPEVVLALELGGNNPLVAWDGDAAAIASLVVASAFITTGQRCSCARRLILPEAGAANMIEAIEALTARLRIGAWDEEPTPFMGPLIVQAAAQRARAQLAALVDVGARLIRPIDHPKGVPFVQPAMVDVTGVDVPDEEIFGPVLQIRRVGDFDEAMAAANNTRFGLAAGLISADPLLWARFLRESRAGVVNWNRPTTGASSGLPFGGLGESGNHRPSAYYAADYCAYPVASLEAALPVDQTPGLVGIAP